MNKSHKWLDDLIKNAPTLKDYKRHGRIQGALEAIARLNQLSYPVERETTGEYLPPLPELTIGSIHVLTAGMNAGKTTRIGVDLVQWAKVREWNVLVISPLNSLGQQTAKDWELSHIHDFGLSKAEQEGLWASVSASHGVVMCPDSLHRIPQWFWSRPTLLILDEANQVIDHITQGNTLGTRWAEILELFSAIACQSAQTGAIVLSEAGIPDRAVKFVQTVADCDRVRVFKHIKQGKPWNCSIFSGQASGFRARLIQSIQQGDRILIVTSSQREARRLQKVISQKLPSIKAVRVDSETNQQGAFSSFFENPDQWLKDNQPDVLILSPSAKSGVSIEGNVPVESAYFSSVWGYFPTLATDTHMQLLGRYRPSVPRYIFVPPFIMTDGDESLFTPRAVKRRLNTNLKGFAGVYDLHELIEADDTRAESLVRIETAVLDYLAASKTVSGAQKSIAHDALAKELETAGHTVKCVQSQKDATTVELWKDIQEEIWREDAAAIASAVVEDRHTPEWAHRTLESLEVSLETRILAQKVIWREQFPGILFDDAEECYQTLCKDYGAMRRGVTLQAKAENLEAAKEGDRASVEAILKSRIRAIHHLPKNYFKALLIAKTGVLELLNGECYSNTHPKALQIRKAALYWANEISYWLRLQIKPDQTPVEICNKLIRKIGLNGVADSRPGQRGTSRDRVYVIEGMENPVRQRLLEALRRKTSSSVSTVCNKDNSSIQIMDTSIQGASTLPPKTDFSPQSLVKWGSRICDWVILEIEGAIAKVRQVNTPLSSVVWDAPIDELRLIA
ncbi:MAG: plasmid replication protein, CyRepA1 family [Oculatellaceae cyanobacterium bins.114]|nr:plasmid replication protein, CyRepA1 family [Oculatellaceae cyanobacterium bins.114]